MKTVLLSAAVLFVFGLSASERQVQIGEKASALGNGNWQWTVFLGGTQESLAAVKCVRYSLDADVPEPDRKVCQAGRAGLSFATSGGATRSFSLKATVEWDDGRATELTYKVRPPALQ
jgi:hypothetical protein